jgi:hypothetical protein
MNPAELQDNISQVPAGEFHDPLADGHAAGEHDGIDDRVGDHLLGLRNAAGHDVQGPGGKSGLGIYLADHEGCKRRRTGGPENYCVSGCKRACHIQERNHKREIPGRDDQGRAEGLEKKSALLVGKKRDMGSGLFGSKCLPLVPAVIIQVLQDGQHLHSQRFDKRRSLFHGYEPGDFVYPL